jgi:hypothetical protein
MHIRFYCNTLEACFVQHGIMVDSTPYKFSLPNRGTQYVLHEGEWLCFLLTLHLCRLCVARMYQVSEALS